MVFYGLRDDEKKKKPNENISKEIFENIQRELLIDCLSFFINIYITWFLFHIDSSDKNISYENEISIKLKFKNTNHWQINDS